jgi:hypothetical protein
VKHPDGVSGCPNGKGASSGRPFSLSKQACLCILLHGTTSGCHLSSVRTVNLVGLNRFPLVWHVTLLLLFVLFVVLCLFPVIFMPISHVHMSFLRFLSSPSMDFFPFFYYFLISFMLIIVISKGLIIFGSMWFKHVNFMLIFFVVGLRYCCYLSCGLLLWFLCSCNFWDSPFYICQNAQIFFGLTRFYVFMDFFLAQEICLQMILHPELGKEMKNQLLTGSTACNHGKSYWRGIFSTPI